MKSKQQRPVYAYLVGEDGAFFRCDAARVRESLIVFTKGDIADASITVDATGEFPRWTIDGATFTELRWADFSARGVHHGKAFFDFSDWPKHVKAMRFNPA